MDSLLELLNGLIWSSALIYLALGAGLYFTIRTRFMQLRSIGDMVRLMFSGRASEAGVSSFQALALSLSGRVGIGNIAGVATAIAAGGPGAVFWMWVMAFLGASTAYVEATLAQIYKEKDDEGRYRGGPAYYIEKAMGQRWYAWLFALVTVVATGLLLPGVQANGIAEGMRNAWGLSPWLVSLVVALPLALIIFGGVKRIASFAQVVVPFMAFGYIVVAIVVMAINIDRVPDMFALILRSAFGFDAAFGAMLGLAIEWGVKRGIYSNEAGQGTAPHAAAAAEVAHPAEQGYVQAFSVYIDTLLVCSATAFMILSSGMYNIAAPAGGFLVENLAGVTAGPGFSQAAVETALPGFGASFIALALLFFAFTTILAYYYMAETNLSFMTRDRPRRWMVTALRAAIIVAVVVGAVRSAGAAWTLGDIGVGLMAWLNIIAILILQKPALLALRDYERQRKAGVEPRFDPDALGIRNADIWKLPPAVRRDAVPDADGDGVA